MLDPVALRLRLGVRSACLSAWRRKHRAQRLAPYQTAMIGGLALASAWSGGAAMAQVATLAVHGELLQPAALIAAPEPPRRPPPLSAETESRLRAEADIRRRAELAAIDALRGAAHLPGAAPDAAGQSGPGLIGLLSSVEQAAGVRLAKAQHVFKMLGVRAGVADGSLALVRTSSVQPPTTSQDPDASAQLQRTLQQVRALEAVNAALVRLPIAEPLTDPVKSSGFGGRSDPFTGEGAFHAGQDFAGTRMTPILTTADGVVSFVGQRNGYGNVVEVDHGGGYKTRYAHMAAFGVRVGQTVKTGARLGGMGSTGRSTGTHLHYEVWVNGQVVNPERFLRAGQSLNGLELANDGGDAPARGAHRRWGRRHGWSGHAYARRGGRVRARFNA